MKRTWMLSTFLSAALLATASAAMADVGPERGATMKEVGKAMKALAEIAKGAPFDAAMVSASAASLETNFLKFGTLFPVGSETASKAASPDIWTNPKDFDNLRTKAQSAATKLISVDEAGFKAAFGELAGTCKACHTKYRISE